MVPSSLLKGMLTEENGATPAVRVVQALTEHRALSATQLARITRLGKSSIASALSSLRESEMVIERFSAGREKSTGVGAQRPISLSTLQPEHSWGIAGN